MSETITDGPAKSEPCCKECADSARSVTIWRGVGIAIGAALMGAFLLFALPRLAAVP